MNKISQDKMFLIILVATFAAGATFLGALTMSGIAGKHGDKEAPAAHAAAEAPAAGGEHH